MLRILPEDEWYKRDSHNQKIQEVEPWPAEGSRMKNETVGYDFEAHLDREDGREEVVEVIKNL